MTAGLIRIFRFVYAHRVRLSIALVVLALVIRCSRYGPNWETFLFLFPVSIAILAIYFHDESSCKDEDGQPMSPLVINFAGVLCLLITCYEMISKVNLR